jgi:YesN/AraC family two-component response regulator
VQHKQDISVKFIKIITLFSVLFAVINSIVPIYTYLKLHSLREKNGEPEIYSVENFNEKKEIEKYDAVYSQILKYFEQEKPYTDPDLSITKISITKDTNIKYVSQAIHHNTGMNFSAFVNSYRIRLAKNMIQEGTVKKYTMHHIYTSVGFKHQSTFNKVFKRFEGISPSEYIASLSK